LNVSALTTKEAAVVRIGETIYCDGCGVEILLSPVVVDEKYYCCRDCSDGLECECGPELADELEE
jgi:hypothetical protein